MPKPDEHVVILSRYKARLDPVIEDYRKLFKTEDRVTAMACILADIICYSDDEEIRDFVEKEANQIVNERRRHAPDG